MLKIFIDTARDIPPKNVFAIIELQRVKVESNQSLSWQSISGNLPSSLKRLKSVYNYEIYKTLPAVGAKTELVFDGKVANS